MLLCRDEPKLRLRRVGEYSCVSGTSRCPDTCSERAFLFHQWQQCYRRGGCCRRLHRFGVVTSIWSPWSGRDIRKGTVGMEKGLVFYGASDLQMSLGVRARVLRTCWCCGIRMPLPCRKLWYVTNDYDHMRKIFIDVWSTGRSQIDEVFALHKDS